MRRHLLITGGTGYIGSELVREALEQGHAVTVADLVPPAAPFSGRLRYQRYSLTDAVDARLLETVEAVIHLAADTSSGPGRLDEEVEIKAGISLFHAASARGCRFIFVSSQSAVEDSPTPYGRIKWHIEHTVLEGGGFVVRPGLVYGGRHDGGVFGALCALARRLPLLPDLRPGPIVQPVYLHDLCGALLRLACDPGARPGAYNIGDPHGISFTDFLRGIARYRLRRKRFFLPVPMALFAAAARLQRSFPRLPEMGGERILGLARLPKMDTQESLRRLCLQPTPLPLGMIRGAANARRLTAWEGRALLRYLMGRKVSPGLVKRYVRGVEMLFNAVPLPLPNLFLKFPGAFCLLDANRPVLRRFGWLELTDRLALAAALCEATPQGATRFLNLNPRRPLAAWLFLSGIAAKEAFVKCGQLICAAFSLIVPRPRSYQ